MSLEDSRINVVGSMDRHLAWRYHWPDSYAPPCNLVWKTFVVKLVTPIDEKTLATLSKVANVVENLTETLVLVQAKRVKAPVEIMLGPTQAVYTQADVSAPWKGADWYHANLEKGEFRSITKPADEIAAALPGCEIYLVRNMLPTFDVIYVPGPHPYLAVLEDEEKDKKSKKRKRAKK